MTFKSVSFPATQRILLFLSIFCLFTSFATNSRATTIDTGKFPLYKAISNNVAFWEKIYSTYSLNEAVIHDSEDLSKIYEVIPMFDHELPRANRLNSIVQKQAMEKYSVLLKKLGHQKPTTPDEVRIAALFPGKHAGKEMQLAANNVRSQSGQKERFLAGVIRSGAYMEEIKRILRTYRLPDELAYLPHVESSFDTNAYSKFGAAGIWQFTRATGKQYLTIDDTVDERLDPILATHAAAKYLKKSYSHLDSWSLALTSYNYGLAGMLRAQNEEGDYVKIFNNYNKGHFKFASKNFYSEFLAALKVARQLETSKKDKLAPPESYRYLNLSEYIDLKDVVTHFGISSATLKSFNPALRPSVFSGEKLIPKGYALRLPAGNKTKQLAASVPASVYKNKQKASLFHRVQKGETAGSIAQRYGVSTKNLMRANNLDEYATIYIRQKLKIPKSAATSASKKESAPKLSAQTKTKTDTSGQDPATPILSASKKQRPAEKGDDFFTKKDPTVYKVFNTHKKEGSLHGYITVQPGESLGLYADWLGTSASSISVLNGFKTGASIAPGQKLLLVFNQLSPNHFENKRLDFLQETEEDFFSAFAVVGQKIYRVNSGDTLWDLCYNKFDIPLWLLERYNSTINLTMLNKEQELIVPIVQSI